MSKFHEDLVAALGEIENPNLDGKANYGKYATLPACLESARKTLTAHNLAVVQMAYTEPDRLITRLVHSTGEWLEDGGVPLLCENKANPQKMGSAITYARRYGLCAMLGIVGEEDDDGQRATPPRELPKEKNPAKKEQKKELPKRADEIPFSEADEKTDWDKFVTDHIAGMQKHRHMAEHQRWSKTYRDERTLLGEQEPELHAKLLAAYMSRKNQLTNRS